MKDSKILCTFKERVKKTFIGKLYLMYGLRLGQMKYI